MSKQQWYKLWSFYRCLNKSNSIARTLVNLEMWLNFSHEQVDLLEKVVLAADDSLGRV